MREPRHPVDIVVDCTTSDFFTAGRMLNISRGGLFIETRDPLPIHSAVALKLHLPEIDAVLSLEGRVIWTYDMKKGTAKLMTGSGIKFVGMTAAQRQTLESYIARIAEPPSPAYAATGS